MSVRREYWVPSLVIAVAILQMAAVSFGGLSPWRGGGFGMYTTLHPNKTRVLFRCETRLCESTDYIVKGPEMHRIRRVCQRLANPSCLERLARSIEPKRGNMRLELWKPVLEGDGSILRRELVASYAY